MRVKFLVLEIQKQRFSTKAGKDREQEVAILQDATPDPTMQLFEWPQHDGVTRPVVGSTIEVRITQIEGWFNGRARIQCVPIAK